MADLLIDATTPPRAARSRPGRLAATPTRRTSGARYRGAVAKGIADNRESAPDRKDARAGPPVRAHEEMILRFAADLAVGHSLEHEPERDGPQRQGAAADLRRKLAHPGRPGRLRASSSPICPPPANGASMLLDALRDLFNGRAWLPPGLQPRRIT